MPRRSEGFQAGLLMTLAIVAWPVSMAKVIAAEWVKLFADRENRA